MIPMLIGASCFFLFLLLRPTHSSGISEVPRYCATVNTPDDPFCPFLLSLTDFVLNFYYKDPSEIDSLITLDYSPVKEIVSDYCKEWKQSTNDSNPLGPEGDVINKANFWCSKNEYLDFRGFIGNVFIEEIKFFSTQRFFPTDSYLYIPRVLEATEGILWSKLSLADKARLERVVWLYDNLLSYLKRHLMRRTGRDSRFGPTQIFFLMGGSSFLALLILGTYLTIKRRRLELGHV